MRGKIKQPVERPPILGPLELWELVGHSGTPPPPPVIYGAIFDPPLKFQSPPPTPPLGLATGADELAHAVALGLKPGPGQARGQPEELRRSGHHHSAIWVHLCVDSAVTAAARNSFATGRITPPRPVLGRRGYATRVMLEGARAAGIEYKCRGAISESKGGPRGRTICRRLRNMLDCLRESDGRDRRAA